MNLKYIKSNYNSCLKHLLLLCFCLLISNNLIAQNTKIIIKVSKSKQKMFIYENNVIIDSFFVSTGKSGSNTPNFNTRLSGKLKMKHSSNIYPGGDYQGLGNMPYCIFIKGAYAIHGTPKKNFTKIGNKVSHGCVRLHPQDAKWLFNKVLEVGAKNCWIIVA